MLLSCWGVYETHHSYSNLATRPESKKALAKIGTQPVPTPKPDPIPGMTWLSCELCGRWTMRSVDNLAKERARLRARKVKAHTFCSDCKKELRRGAI